MALTKQDVINYVMTTPGNTNPAVLNSLLDRLIASDNPDLSGITATADKILVGYQGVDTTGAEVDGTCDFDNKLATTCAIEESQSYAEAADVTVTGEGKVVFVYDAVGGTLTPVVGE